MAGGVIVRLPRNWSVHGEYNWSRSQSGYRRNGRTLISSTPLAAVRSGALDVFRDLNAYPLDLTSYLSPDSPQNNAHSENVLKDATLRLVGPVWTLPAGPVMLSSLLERRDEATRPSLKTGFTQNGSVTYTYTPQIGVSTDSAYMELTVPLVSAKNERPGVKGLELQTSYRHDNTTVPSIDTGSYAVSLPSSEGPYPQPEITDVGVNASQYTFGARYQPLEQLALRASYGKGVLSPSLNNLAPLPYPGILVSILSTRYVDPKRGGERLLSLAEFSAGGSGDLRPEQSGSFSAGLIFTPMSIPGLRLSVDYTRIDKVDEITRVDTQVLIDLEDVFSDRITRGELTAADQVLGYTAGPIIALNGGEVNVARTFLEAYDVQADYTWQTAYGEFKASAIGTVQPHLQRQVQRGEPTLEQVGKNLGPLKVRGNVGLTWMRDGWQLGWNMQYYNSYLIYSAYENNDANNASWTARNGSPIIPSQIYHDLFGRYRFGENHGSGWLGLLNNVEVLASVKNVLDVKPPILTDNNQGYFDISPYGDPRLRRWFIVFAICRQRSAASAKRGDHVASLIRRAAVRVRQECVSLLP